jgi:Ca-activated chloride channel homolog
MKVRATAYRIIGAAICLAIISPSLYGQEEREYIRKGNRLYKKGEFAGSEGMYRRAEEQTGSGHDAIFNLGDALYRQNRFSEATAEFSRAAKAGETDSLKRADGLYNLGNSLLKEQKFKESIEAYISSLKLNPDNMQAKYNLAYAQDQLKKQEEQQQQQDQKDQDKNRQDQQNKDQEQKENQEQQDDQDRNRSRISSNNSSSNPAISREDAKRLLDALAANEKETQEKVQRDKAAKAKVRVIKNW